MIISLNWLKKFTEIDMPVDELALLIGARLVEIEEIIDIGKKYQGAIVVDVISVNKLEGSDHLNIVIINDAGSVNSVDRNEDGFIQVVCGAPNIKQGQKVAWLSPGSVVPETYYGDEPFKLEARKLRGVMSNGMIASAKELDLFDDHDGILVLDNELKPGTSFADAYELNDYLIDIENKSLTHRPDCFGVIGFAREVSGILGKDFKTPNYMKSMSAEVQPTDIEKLKLSVSIDDKELSSRYLAVVMSNIDNSRETPLMIQTYLARVGIRPINSVVDVTNYLMLLTGQPLHAFDYDKVLAINGESADIHVRAGEDNEKLILLDNREITLTNSDIVIATGNKPIGLAGAMGGFSTEIDSNTKRIIIESATFNLFNLRNTQMRFGIFSEAITRFTKGQPAELAMPVLNLAINMISDWTGATAVSDVVEDYPDKQADSGIDISASQINNILGSDLNIENISNILRSVEFIVDKKENNKYITKAPYWRSDIHVIEDVAEELGRISGFDNISPVLPIRNFSAIRPNEFDEFRKTIRKLVASSGANEVVTYSFIHGDILNKSGQDTKNSYRIINSISPDLQYYRQTLTPSLLSLIHPNIKQGFGEFAVYEINKTHSRQNGLNEENVPVENDMMSLVYSNKNEKNGAAYYFVKNIIDFFAKRIGAELEYVPLQYNDNYLVSAFEPRRSASILDKSSGVVVGVVGEYKKKISKSFKLPDYTAGFEFDLNALFGISKGTTDNYKPVSKFPSTERDICFQVSKDTEYSKIVNLIKNELSESQLDYDVSPVDLYKPENLDTKNITIRIRLVSYTHTLTGEEINLIINRVSNIVIKEVNGAII